MIVNDIGTTGKEKEIFKTKDGKRGILYCSKAKDAFGYPKSIFIKWRTKEEWAEYLRLYSTNNFKYTEEETMYNTDKDSLKFIFPERLKNVFSAIEEKWNEYWVAKHTGIDRTCINRMLNGFILPTMQSLLRLLIFINNHIDNFDIMYLFAPQVKQMQNEKNYKIGTLEQLFKE